MNQRTRTPKKTPDAPFYDPALEQRAADLSTDGLYRYTLSRTWGPGRRVLWVMLNPSTADAMQDDPTIKKCRGFAQQWRDSELGPEARYGGIVVVNLFAYRATDPADLTTAQSQNIDIVGPDNDRFIHDAFDLTIGRVILGWGANFINGATERRAKEFLPKLWARCEENHASAPRVLGLNQDKSPKHPLYIPYSAVPQILSRP